MGRVADEVGLDQELGGDAGLLGIHAGSPQERVREFDEIARPKPLFAHVSPPSHPPQSPSTRSRGVKGRPRSLATAS